MSNNKEELKLSFEFFPAKNEELEAKAWDSVKKLETFNPQFYSVTFGAGGGERLKTDSFVKKINKDSNIPVAGHLTCVDMTKEEINDLALGWYEKGINNIVALRGDVRTEGAKYNPHREGYINAADMVAGLKKLENFDIAVGGYPEIHPDSKNKKEDIENLKRKVDAGADKIITQFFFDKDIFLKYRDEVRKSGIKVDVIPGIMPISNFKQIKNFSAKCGTSIPDSLEELFKGTENDLKKQQFLGINLATKIVKDLLKEDVKEFHFYTLNKYEMSYEVCARLISQFNKQKQTENNKEART